MSDGSKRAGGAGKAKVVGQVVAIGAVAGLFALLVWKVAFGDGGGVAEQLAKGNNPAAPAFSLPRIDGTPGNLVLASLKGRPIVVNFWASWCIPCKGEAPALQATYEKYRKQGLVVLGINAQDFRKDAMRFMKRFDVTYPVVYDGRGSTLGTWGVTGFPETFFVDRRGRLVGDRIEGGIDTDRNKDAFAEGLALALGTTQ